MSGLDPIEAVGVFLSAGALYTGALIWITSRLAALREKQAIDIGALRLEMNTKVEAARDSAEAGVKNVKSEEAKSRHDLANSAQNSLLQIQTQVNQLREGSATKPELAAVEGRLTAAMGEIKAQVAKISDKLDVIPELKSDITTLSRQIREALGGKAA